MLGLTSKCACGSGNMVLFIVIKGLWMIHLAFQHSAVARRLRMVVYMPWQMPCQKLTEIQLVICLVMTVRFLAASYLLGASPRFSLGLVNMVVRI